MKCGYVWKSSTSHTHTACALFIRGHVKGITELRNKVSHVTQWAVRRDAKNSHDRHDTRTCTFASQVVVSENVEGDARRVRRRTRQCPQSQTSDTSMPTESDVGHVDAHSQMSDTSMPAESDVGHVNAHRVRCRTRQCTASSQTSYTQGTAYFLARR